MKESNIRDTAKTRDLIELRHQEIRDFFLDHTTMRPSALRCERRESCPCGSYPVPQTRLFKKDGFVMYRCDRGCGLIYSDAIARTEAFEEFLNCSEAVKTYHKGTLVAFEAERARHLFGEQFERLCTDFPDGGRLLDVGCSSGTFLDLIAARGGWQCFGVEPYGQAREIGQSKGHTVLPSLDDLESSLTFDAVTLLHGVLSHMPNPFAVLKCIYRSLRRGGKVYIKDVDCNGFDILMMGVDHYVFCPPIYPVNLSGDSMVNLMRESGFIDVEVRSIGKLDVANVRNGLKQQKQSAMRAGLLQFLERLGEAGRERLQNFLLETGRTGYMLIVGTKSHRDERC